MSQASRDENRVTSLLGVSSINFSTPTTAAVNPSTHAVLVEATLSGGSSDGAILDGVSSSIKATVLDLTSSNPLTVALVDANGAQLTSFTVTQATGTNLHTVIDSGTITTVSTITNLSTIATVAPTFGDINNSATETGSLDIVPVGRYNTTLPTITDTRYNQFQVGLRGALQVNLLSTDGTTTQFLASAALADTASATPATTTVGVVPLLMNASTLDRARAVVNALNSIGTGVAAAGMVAQFDDTSPTTVTENQFGNLRMSTNGVLYVGGEAASGAADAGNPIKIGARFNTTAPTFTDGQRGDLQLGTRGSLRIEIMGSNGTTPINNVADNADGVVTSSSTNSMKVLNRNMVFNTSTWDRMNTVINATNSVGTGITAAGILAQFDDTSPTSITENQFGNLRMSANRNFYTTIRDAAGNERGLNIDASGQLAITIASAQTLATVSTVTNLSQMNGAAISMGVGATGTGVQRIVPANDFGKTLVSTGGSAASNGNNTLVAAGTARLKVYAFSLSTTTTTSVTCIFQSGAGGTELWRVVLQAPTSVNTGANLSVSPPAWLFATASATLLNLNLSSAQTVHWSVSYYDEA